MRSLLLIAAVLLSGCASSPTAAPAARTAVSSAPAEPRYFAGDGATATLDQIVAAAAGSDAVVIGENHGHPLGLSTAARVWSGVLEKTDKSALALEFFERDEQSRLDEYLLGVTDETAFKKRTSRNDGSYPPGHREMVEAAKAAHRPVIASNAPRPLVRIAGKEGGYDKLRALPPGLRALVCIPDSLPTGRYREDYEKVIRDMGLAHGPPPKDEAERQKRLDLGFQSQSLWDWTMADSIAGALHAGNRPVVQVVGRFHEDFRGGLVQALDKLRPGVKTLTITFAPSWSDSLRDEDKGRADYVIYVGPAPEEAAKP